MGEVAAGYGDMRHDGLVARPVERQETREPGRRLERPFNLEVFERLMIRIHKVHAYIYPTEKQKKGDVMMPIEFDNHRSAH